jgi:hypothetical protein
MAAGIVPAAAMVVLTAAYLVALGMPEVAPAGAHPQQAPSQDVERAR